MPLPHHPSLLRQPGTRLRAKIPRESDGRLPAQQRPQETACDVVRPAAVVTTPPAQEQPNRTHRAWNVPQSDVVDLAESHAESAAARRDRDVLRTATTAGDFTAGQPTDAHR